MKFLLSAMAVILDRGHAQLSDTSLQENNQRTIPAKYL
jgi:hypothetical protein